MPIFSTQLSGSVYSHMSGTLSISGSTPAMGAIGSGQGAHALQVTGSAGIGRDLFVSGSALTSGSLYVSGNIVFSPGEGGSFKFAPKVGRTGGQNNTATQFRMQDTNLRITTVDLSAGTHAQIRLRGARGTMASPSAVSNGDSLGAIRFYGFDTDYAESAKIVVKAAAAHGGDSTDSPGKMEFYTTPDNSETPTLALTLESDQVTHTAGALKVGGDVIQASDGGSTITMDTSDNVTIGGNLQVNGNSINDSGAAAALTFDGSQNVSMPKAGAVSFTIGTDAGADRSVLFGHNTIKTRMGIDTSGDDGRGVFAINTDLEFEAGNDFEINHQGNVTIGNGNLIVDGVISGSSNQSLKLYSDHDVIVQIDQEGDSTSKFKIQIDGENTKFEVNEDGDTQMDGNLIVDGTGNSTFAGNLDVADRIRHIGDTDTQIRFSAANKISFEAGGVGMTLWDGNSAQKEIAVNNSNVDHDFRVATSGETNTLFVEGSSNNVGIGVTPTSKLHVKGDFTVQDSGGSDIIGKLYASSDDGVLDIYANNAVTTQIHGNADSYFAGGQVGFGVTDPDHQVEILATADAFKISYDAANHTTFNTTNTGRLDIEPSSGITLFKGTTPHIHVGDDGAENSGVIFDAAIGDWRVGANNAKQRLEVGAGGSATYGDSGLALAVSGSGAIETAMGTVTPPSVLTNKFAGKSAAGNAWICIARTRNYPQAADFDKICKQTFFVTMATFKSGGTAAIRSTFMIEASWAPYNAAGGAYSDPPVTEVIVDQFDATTNTVGGYPVTMGWNPERDCVLLIRDANPSNKVFYAELYVRCKVSDTDVWVSTIGGVGSKQQLIGDPSPASTMGWKLVAESAQWRPGANGTGNASDHPDVDITNGSRHYATWANKIYRNVHISGSLTYSSPQQNLGQTGNMRISDNSIRSLQGEIAFQSNSPNGDGHGLFEFQNNAGSDRLTVRLGTTTQVIAQGSHLRISSSWGSGQVYLESPNNLYLTAEDELRLECNSGGGTDKITFFSNGVEKGEIDASGNLQIDGDLTVSGGDVTASKIETGNDLILKADDNSVIMEIEGATAQTFTSTLHTFAGAGAVDANSGNLYLRTNGTSRLTVESSTGDIGIGDTTPSYRLDVKDDTNTSYIAQFDSTSTSNDTDGMRIDIGGNSSAYAGYFFYLVARASSGLKSGAWISDGDGTSTIEYTFTGTHDAAFESSDIALPGMIVESTGEVWVKNTDTSKNVFSYHTALPYTRLTSTNGSKAVFGVINIDMLKWIMEEEHDGEGKIPNPNRGGLARGVFPGLVENNPLKENHQAVQVMSLGEGTVWVTNINGNIENGDLIESSSVPGYGRLQDDDIMRSKTVAKCTQNVDWESVTDTIEHAGQSYKKYLVTCTFHCG